MGDGYLGEIRMVAFNFAPQYWAFCNGQTLSIASNNALFALLGTFYGGDGISTFKLPDFRGRVPLAFGQGPNLPVYEIGENGGQPTMQLSQAQLPSHTHLAQFQPSGGGGTPTVSVTVNGSSAHGNSGSATGNYIAGMTDVNRSAGQLFVNNPEASTLGAIAGVSATISGVPSGGGTVTNAVAGQGQAFSIEPPYLSVNFVICTQGIYPSRS